jgi:hypothetical protein
VLAADKLGLNGVHPVFIYADVNVLDDIMEIMNTVNNIHRHKLSRPDKNSM